MNLKYRILRLSFDFEMLFRKNATWKQRGHRFHCLFWKLLTEITSLILELVRNVSRRCLDRSLAVSLGFDRKPKA